MINHFSLLYQKKECTVQTSAGHYMVIYAVVMQLVFELFYCMSVENCNS